MARQGMPWWLGYLLISPLRRWIGGDPEDLLRPYLHAGMTVLEPGPGMGYFTLPMAAMTGPRGRIVAVDIQPHMLAELRRRAQKAGLRQRIDTRLAQPHSMGLDDLKGKVDFVLAFAMVHEMPSAESFFAEASDALRSRGLMLLVEPRGHVSQFRFEEEIGAARAAGLKMVTRLKIRRSRAAVLQRS